MKKLLASTLATTMILSLMVGCAKTPPASSSTPDPSTSTPPVAELKVGDPFGSANAPVEVSIILKDVAATDENTIMLVTAIEEGMAELDQFVDLTFLEAPSGTYGEAVPIAVRTGQISPDIIYFQGGDLPLANDGQLEDLSSYIDASTNIKNMMQPAHTEKIANYPYLLWLAPSRVNVPMIRSDYTEFESVKTVMEDPTIENYDAMYRDLVARGVADYAFTADGNLTRLDGVFNQAFGVTGAFIMTDDGYKSSKISAAEKEKLAFYAELYADGLIDPNYVTNKWDIMENNFFSNASATMAGTGGIVQIYNNKMVQTNDQELVILPPAKGVAQGYTAVDVTKESRGFAINADSDVKIEAFSVLEFMSSDAGRVIDKVGIEGVHYNITADGKYELTERYPEWWARVWDTLNQFPEDIEFVSDPVSQAQYDALAAMDEYYVKDTNVIFPDELQPIWDSLNSLYASYSVEIITGKRPISDFDTMVTEWYELGGEQIDTYVNENLK